MPVGVVRNTANDAAAAVKVAQSDVAGYRACLSGVGINLHLQGRTQKLVKIIKTRDLIGSRLHGSSGVAIGGIAANAGWIGGNVDKVMD